MTPKPLVKGHPVPPPTKRLFGLPADDAVKVIAPLLSGLLAVGGGILAFHRGYERWGQVLFAASTIMASMTASAMALQAAADRKAIEARPA